MENENENVSQNEQEFNEKDSIIDELKKANSELATKLNNLLEQITDLKARNETLKETNGMLLMGVANGDEKKETSIEELAKMIFERI